MSKRTKTNINNVQKNKDKHKQCPKEQRQTVLLDIVYVCLCSFGHCLCLSLFFWTLFMFVFVLLDIVYVCLCSFGHCLCKTMSKRTKTNINNVQKNKDKHDLQSITQKTTDWGTEIPHKTVGELWFSKRISSSCSTSDTCRVTLVIIPVIIHKWGKDLIVTTTGVVICVTDIS
jgi:predicted membrane protein